jgi:hypothetical protein
MHKCCGGQVYSAVKSLQAYLNFVYKVMNKYVSDVCND